MIWCFVHICSLALLPQGSSLPRSKESEIPYPSPVLTLIITSPLLIPLTSKPPIPFPALLSAPSAPSQAYPFRLPSSTCLSCTSPPPPPSPFFSIDIGTHGCDHVSSLPTRPGEPPHCLLLFAPTPETEPAQSSAVECPEPELLGRATKGRGWRGGSSLSGFF